MLVIRGTKKLLIDMKMEKAVGKIDISDSFFSWHANLVMVNRRKHVIFMNDLSRLSITMSGIRSTQYKNLKDLFLKDLNDFLISEDTDKAMIHEYINNCENVVVTTTNNRSVISTMNDVVLIMQEARTEFENLLELNKWNNTIIYKPINYARPLEFFKAELKSRYSTAPEIK
ncbi:DUF6933 domain-containing protein [Paenibacillus sp. TAB 01]|uniref:DUF6933 domain-containing protein n=1 Tax=Paenibacillus sp. TAB 01 TaxID=3368988 RepID=UPI0037528E41